MSLKNANIGICPINGEIHLIVEPEDGSPSELFGVIDSDQARSMAELLIWAANILEDEGSNSVKH